MAALLVGEQNTGLVVRSDGDAVKDAVARIARDVDVKVVEAQITFPDGKAQFRASPSPVGGS